MIDHGLRAERHFAEFSACASAPSVHIVSPEGDGDLRSWPASEKPSASPPHTALQTTFLGGSIISVTLHAAICAALVLVWSTQLPKTAASEAISIEITAEAAPPEPMIEDVKEQQTEEISPEINLAEALPEPPEPAPVVIPVPVQVAVMQPPPPQSMPQRQEKPKPQRKPEQTPRRARDSSGTTEQREARSSTPPANYLGQVAAMLHRAKVYPASARERGEQGRAVIRFTILRSGSASGAVLVRSSGHSTLDQAASGVIARAGPFPPLPESYALPAISVTVPIEYSLR